MSIDRSKEAYRYDEIAATLYEAYSIDAVADLLLSTGLLSDKSIQYIGSFEEYVFLHGVKDEVYTKQEIDFVSSIKEIAVFTEFYKQAKKGVIPCRIISVRNPAFDTLDFCIALTKILSKAIEGFSICVVVGAEGITLSCRAYDRFTTNNYYVSDILSTEEQIEDLSDKLMYITEYDGFVDYYCYIRESIRFRVMPDDYPMKAHVRNRQLYDYIDVLQTMARSTGYNFSGEIERCFWAIDEKHEKTYADRVAEAESNLFNIESSRINTLEILFEAEEMEKLASETEQRNATMILQTSSEDNAMLEIDTETKAMLKDPELMIKHLKAKQNGK